MCTAYMLISLTRVLCTWYNLMHCLIFVFTRDKLDQVTMSILAELSELCLSWALFFIKFWWFFRRIDVHFLWLQWWRNDGAEELKQHNNGRPQVCTTCYYLYLSCISQFYLHSVIPGRWMCFVLFFDNPNRSDWIWSKITCQARSFTC